MVKLMNKSQLKAAVRNAQETLSVTVQAADIAEKAYLNLRFALDDLINKEAQEIRKMKEQSNGSNNIS